MSTADTENSIFKENISFEDEMATQRKEAPDYRLCSDCAFRANINRAVRFAVWGQRSVENFVEFAAAAIIDKESYFKGIPMKMLYFNSIKIQESRWEVLCEQKDKTPKQQEKCRKSTENIINIIKGLVEKEAISKNECKVHLSIQLLVDTGIVVNRTYFERRLIRINTSLLYKQDKYNLVREANEGYSSLFNELTTASIDNERDDKGKLVSTPMKRIPEFLKTITSHIGVFRLDPNRVLDIILDFFIRQLKVNYQFWIELIKQSEWIQKIVYTDINLETSINPSAIMAQLFGFRFHTYHEEEVTPAPSELYLAIALLLKNDLIVLGDILPYLYPYCDAMEVEKKEYISKMNKEITSNSGGKLGMYGALGEEGATQKTKRATNNTTKEAVTEQESVQKYEANDVVELVKALFSIGDLTNAQKMLSEYDKLIDLYPQLAYDIYRLCRVVLQPAYQNFASQKTRKLYEHFAQCAQQSQLKSALSTQDDPNPKLPSQITLKRILVTDALLNDTQDLVKKERYVFFYKEWQESLHLCSTPAHLTAHFMPLMRLAGNRTYLATDLIQTMILCIGGLLEQESEFPGSRVHCMNMLREFLLPAISFSQDNPGTMASVWEILCRFTFQERYCLYGEWYNDFYKKSIETKLLKARTERSVKDVMRRVSKNDVRRCGRDLGKLAHSNPTIVFNVMLDQVQQFDNMAPMMADACRYLGDFAYDVLGYVMTEKWTGSLGPGRTLKQKEKDDGMPSTWLRALSVFSGMLFKKQDIDSTPLLRYIACRLREDDSVADLILLNEFVTKMGGIEILASACTEDQITAAGCSSHLKNEAFLPISMDNRRASRRVLNRLKDSLRRNNVGFEILVLLYRLEEACSGETGVNASDRCSKLDRVRQTQSQYLELLTSLFEDEEYDALVPNVDILVKDYALPVDIAMNFNRPKTQCAIRNKLDAPIVPDQVWAPFEPLEKTISALLPDPPLNSIFSSEFFVIFWQLGLYDIYCPEKHYKVAIERNTEMLRQCQDTRSNYYQSNRPSVVSKSERQAQVSLEILREDLPKHKTHVEKILAVLKSSMSRWFTKPNQRQAQILSIMQHCLLPRSRQSEVDAAFCYEFTMIMHRINTPNFSSLTLFDKMLSDNLPASFLAFTEYETTIYSRFIFKALSHMQHWHKDEKVYQSEAHGNNLIGFQKNWNAGATTIAEEDLLSFNEFQRVLNKWHFKSALAIEQALKSGETHVIKNAFLVLRQFIPCFPAVVDHGNSIIKIVTKLSNEEKRGNIKVLARSYLGLINKYKSKWMTKEKFLGIEEPAPPVELKITPPTAPAPPTNGSSRDVKESNRDANKDKDFSRDTNKDKESSKDKERSSSDRHESRNEESSKHRSENGERHASRPASPSRRGDDRSSRNASQTSPSSLTRKRSREQDTITRSEKSPRIADESSSRHHHRRSTSNNGTPSSSRRESPRESKDITSRLSTPTRSSNVDLSRSSTSARDTGRDTVRESSSRKEFAVPAAVMPRGRGASAAVAAAAAAAVASNGSSSHNTSNDERNGRSSRSQQTEVSGSNNNNVSGASSRREDERSTTSRAVTGPPSSSSADHRNSSSSKRPLDDRNDRHERPEKRRDIRDDRSRSDRGRMDDRRDDRRGGDDRRRADDRRVDDRRDRDRHDRRRRR